jgi:hypothetical protein
VNAVPAIARRIVPVAGTVWVRPARHVAWPPTESKSSWRAPSTTVVCSLVFQSAETNAARSFSCFNSPGVSCCDGSKFAPAVSSTASLGSTVT